MIMQPSTTLEAPVSAIENAEFSHENVLVSTGKRSGLIISVAVHSTVLGQALGGARMWNYPHWTDAVADSLRLSAAMTLKNSAAGLNRGGGKSVIHIPMGVLLTPEQKRDAMLDLGDAIESLNGAYMTAEDVGTSRVGPVNRRMRLPLVFTRASSPRVRFCSALATLRAVTSSFRGSDRLAAASRDPSQPQEPCSPSRT